jgi:hypothetical protein
VCFITIYCIWEYYQNTGLQKKADDFKTLVDNEYALVVKTTENIKIYNDFINAYTEATSKRNESKNADLMVGGICGIFVGYYIFTNFIKK